MSGRGQAVNLGGSSPSDIEIARWVVPYPPNGALTELTNIFYVPVDAALGDVIITMRTASAVSLGFNIKYCRGYPGTTTFNTLSGTMTLGAGAHKATISPTWPVDLAIGDYLQLNAVSGNGSDASGLEIVLLRAQP